MRFLLSLSLGRILAPEVDVTFWSLIQHILAFAAPDFSKQGREILLSRRLICSTSVFHQSVRSESTCPTLLRQISFSRTGRRYERHKDTRIPDVCALIFFCRRL